MKNIMKLSLLLVLCLSLLMVVGCSKESEDGKIDPEQTTEAPTGEQTQDPTESQLDEFDTDVGAEDPTENQEGEPFDETTPEGGEDVPTDPVETEPPVGVEEDDEEEESDFEVDFGDLT